jgi:mannosyl-oligosaccharide alpha-1,2-mannosidase
MHATPVLRNIAYLAATLTTLYAVYFITSSNDAFDNLRDKVYPGPSYVSRNRAKQVKSAFVHAYHSYEQYAAPHDELRPGTKMGSDQ